MTDDRLRVGLLTREYPPEVYGGAGVHVEYLARELDRLVDLTAHCFGGGGPGGGAPQPWGGRRGEAAAAGAVAHEPWAALSGNAALQAVSVDLAMAAAVSDAQLVHSHTWYANLGGHL